MNGLVHAGAAKALGTLPRLSSISGSPLLERVGKLKNESSERKRKPYNNRSSYLPLLSSVFERDGLISLCLDSVGLRRGGNRIDDDQIQSQHFTEKIDEVIQNKIAIAVEFIGKAST